MGSVNKVILVGNLGRDAELRHTPGGVPVASFSIATTETWPDKATGQRQEKTEWHRISLWGKMAESLTEYLVKGKQIYLEGRLQTRKWQDKEGHEKFTTEIVADRMQMLGSRAGMGGAAASGAEGDRSHEGGSSSGGGASKPQAKGGAAKFDDFEDDIPF